MKKIIFGIAAFFVAFNVFSQGLPTDPDTKKVTYQETVTVDSISRDEIYERCKYWIANFYKTDKYDIDDKLNYKVSKEGFFVIKLTYDFKYKSDNNVTYFITINQKEGKYRFTITDFTIYNVKTGPKTAQKIEVALAKMSLQNKNELIAQVNKEIADLTEDLKKTIQTGKTPDRDDW